MRERSTIQNYAILACRQLLGLKHQDELCDGGRQRENANVGVVAGVGAVAAAAADADAAVAALLLLLEMLLV